MTTQKPIEVTDLILRDAHQSLIATRLRTEDMLPICEKLDKVGYWSLEAWGAPPLMPVFASLRKIHGNVCVN